MKSNSYTLHLGGADGIRAIACLLVITHHLSQFASTEGNLPWLQALHAFMLTGNSGVSVFFVLSGYLLAIPFWRSYLNGHPFPDMKHYGLRRAVRIIPGYYVAILVSTLLTVLFNIPTENFWLRLSAAITFTSGFHYSTLFPNEVNGPLWSISFEVFCYLLMPVFMYALYRFFGKNRTFTKGLLFWIGTLGIILVLNQLVHIFFSTDSVKKGWDYGWTGGAKYWMPNYNPIGFFAHFTLGIMAAGVAVKLNQHPDKRKYTGIFSWISLGSLASSFVLLWLVRNVPEFGMSLQQQPFYFPLYPLLIAISLCAASRSGLAAKLLDNPFFKFTAKISFSLYIWHFVIIGVSSVTWAQDFMGTENLSHWAGVSLVLFLVSYLVATLSYYFVEKPVLTWSTRERSSIGLVQKSVTK